MASGWSSSSPLLLQHQNGPLGGPKESSMRLTRGRLLPSSPNCPSLSSRPPGGSSAQPQEPSGLTSASTSTSSLISQLMALPAAGAPQADASLQSALESLGFSSRPSANEIAASTLDAAIASIGAAQPSSALSPASICDPAPASIAAADDTTFKSIVDIVLSSSPSSHTQTNINSIPSGNSLAPVSGLDLGLSSSSSPSSSVVSFDQFPGLMAQLPLSTAAATSAPAVGGLCSSAFLPESTSPTSTVVEFSDQNVGTPDTYKYATDADGCKVFTIAEGELPEWLEREQRASRFRFVQCGGKKRRVHGWYWKYVCHCYGKPEVKKQPSRKDANGDDGEGGLALRTECGLTKVSKSPAGAGTRVARKRRSKKVGCPCAAYITCGEDGMATVRYYPVHRGHSLTLKSGARRKPKKSLCSAANSVGDAASAASSISSNAAAASITTADAAGLLMDPGEYWHNTITPSPTLTLFDASPSHPATSENASSNINSSESKSPDGTPLSCIASSPESLLLATPPPLFRDASAAIPAKAQPTGLSNWITVWKSLGLTTFSETTPFSFGFIRPQAFSYLDSHRSMCTPMVLALERTMGTNINGYPLYTLVLRGVEASANSEHLAYLVTSDMSHCAVQKWLLGLRQVLGLSPTTFLLDPDDIAGHTAVNHVFSGTDCLLLWALDRLESKWRLEALSTFSHSDTLNYTNGRMVEEVVWSLLTLAIEGHPRAYTLQPDSGGTNGNDAVARHTFADVVRRRAHRLLMPGIGLIRPPAAATAAAVSNVASALLRCKSRLRDSLRQKGSSVLSLASNNLSFPRRFPTVVSLPKWKWK